MLLIYFTQEFIISFQLLFLIWYKNLLVHFNLQSYKKKKKKKKTHNALYGLPANFLHWKTTSFICPLNSQVPLFFQDPVTISKTPQDMLFRNQDIFYIQSSKQVQQT